MRFARAVARVPDVRLLGVVHTPPTGADAGLFHDLVRVTEPLSLRDILDGVEVLRRRHGQPYRILGILEALMVQLAKAREHFGVPGTPARVAELFRDKSQMKDALRAAGLPVARSALVRTKADAHAFAEAVGFPMVVKPPAGMGSKSTHRVHSLDELIRVADAMGAGPGNPVLAEEFLRGREYSFESLCTGGVPHVESASRYLPGCLEAVENSWIQWCCLLPRDLSDPLFDRARAASRGAIAALGLDDGMTHMEWFERPDGSVVIGEIAQRPPGANISLMTGLAHDVDLYGAWARAVVDGVVEGLPWTRKYAVGSAFLRGPGRGRVVAVTGVHETWEAVGKWVVEANLPTLGAPKSDSYEGDGYVVVRHPDTEVVKHALKTIVDTVRVQYSD